MTIDQKALEACPWHGDNSDLEIDSSSPTCFWVVCNKTGCGCEGPYAESEVGAVAEWNRRAALPASDHAGLETLRETIARDVREQQSNAQATTALSAGVRVKPLKWSGKNADGSVHIANVVPYQYWAWELAGYGYWSWGTLVGREVHGGIDAAKAAAQADYERRILSALSDAPVVTEAMILAGCKVMYPALFRRGLEPLPGDGPATTRTIADTVKTVRSVLTAALGGGE